jgi:hypothetical protein
VGRAKCPAGRRKRCPTHAILWPKLKDGASTPHVPLRAVPRSRRRRPALPNPLHPVPRLRARRNGWTPARQRLFIAALAGCGSVVRGVMRRRSTDSRASSATFETFQLEPPSRSERFAKQTRTSVERRRESEGSAEPHPFTVNLVRLAWMDEPLKRRPRPSSSLNPTARTLRPSSFFSQHTCRIGAVSHFTVLNPGRFSQPDPPATHQPADNPRLPHSGTALAL